MFHEFLNVPSTERTATIIPNFNDLQDDYPIQGVSKRVEILRKPEKNDEVTLMQT